MAIGAHRPNARLTGQVGLCRARRRKRRLGQIQRLVFLLGNAGERMMHQSVKADVHRITSVRIMDRW